jgi:hypothetical protein
MNIFHTDDHMWGYEYIRPFGNESDIDKALRLFHVSVPSPPTGSF